MILLWPGSVFLFAGMPLLAALFWWIGRRRRRATLRYSSLALVRPAVRRQAGLRRFLPPLFYGLALSCLVIALARPARVVSITRYLPTIILSMDVSGSMMQEDIAPNRLAAAKQAALSFIDRRSANTRIGIVDFSTIAALVLPPTTDHKTLKTAITSLTTGQETALGDGIFKSLDAITRVDPQAATTGEEAKTSSAAPVSRPKGAFASGAYAPGAYAPEIIILVSDGASTVGPLPLDAARAAAERGVRIYTIGFNAGGDSPGPADQAPGSLNLLIPATGGSTLPRPGSGEETLIQIAALTGGKYYFAGSAAELEAIFARLPTRQVVRTEAWEISVAFAAAGALLAMAAMVLSLLWSPLP